MATHLKNLSKTTLTKSKQYKDFVIGIVTAQWNQEITFAMRDAAMAYLKEKGVKEKNIIQTLVPGSFELAFGAQLLAQQKNVHGVITIGCVIQGETRHFDFICDACANGIMQVGLNSNKPVIFGVLTTNNMQQAIDRSGGKHGNKGVEAAETVIKMIALQQMLNKH
ncbi:MAG: 6,7-dimethyl-8-ribityllumazine synthase [Bacteroidia bacterium]